MGGGSSSSALDTSDVNEHSEYTVNSTLNTTQNGNSLLREVALSQEHMESALTVGTESLHDQTKSTIAQELCWLLILSGLLWYSSPLDGANMADKCGIDPREEVINFLAWILAPVALTRAVIFAVYRTPRYY